MRFETMFGKAKATSGADRLTERMRRAVDRPTAPPSNYSFARQIERAVRQAVFRQGALILANGEKLSVAIKDISVTGARVEYFTRNELPELIVLVEPTLRIKSKARVVWQREGVAGLAFVE
jgi:hypothetical protein